MAPCLQLVVEEAGESRGKRHHNERECHQDDGLVHFHAFAVLTVLFGAQEVYE